MKLHLGCGNRFLGKDWMHIDICNNKNIDYVMDIRNLGRFEDDSIDEIYACHVFEHFKVNEIIDVLKEWYRVLKPDSKLRLAVPDFESIVNLYLTKKYDLSIFHGLIYGGYKDEYDIHYNIYDQKYLSELLRNIGFKEVYRYDWKDFLPENYDDYSRAYIPHMDFENGTLVSLNLLAIK